MTLACVTFAATNHVSPRATLSNEYGAEFIGSGYYDPINSYIPPKYTDDPIRSYIPPKYTADPIRSYIPPKEKLSKIIENNEPAMDYRFEYNVQDYQSGNNFGHMESREGDQTTGRYHVYLPDGRTQVS